MENILDALDWILSAAVLLLGGGIFSLMLAIVYYTATHFSSFCRIVSVRLIKVFLLSKQQTNKVGPYEVHLKESEIEVYRVKRKKLCFKLNDAICNFYKSSKTLIWTLRM